MEQAIQQLQSKDTKERLAGVEKLQSLLEHSRRGLSAAEASNLVDSTLGLLKDNNFKVCQGALQALSSAAALAGDHLRIYFNALLPAVVERLGDGKQPVRDAARRLLLALMEISSPTTIVERAGHCAWSHKNWRVREEFVRTAASAISLFSAIEPAFQRLLLTQIVVLLEDSNSSVREASMICLEEMYRQSGAQFKEELQRHSLRPSQLKEIMIRFERIVPKMRTSESLPSQEQKHGPPLGNRKNSPKSKSVHELPSTVDAEVNEKPAEPIRVASERELLKEIEKVASMLTPDQDWSVRIAAMQRVEGLVAGGAAAYSAFPSLLRQLVGPLSLQLSDRRSSIVKQACHLLNLLSKDLLSELEPVAEAVIPVLFKLVVITVLVIAESADSCIKTLLRNCKASRVLPRIVDTAKNDRSATLRARCCEYALLVLDQWADSPEIQRSADHYEDLIKCCVGDAMSEVRSTARSCYRLFAKTWPERSRRLFAGFDPVIQKLLNEEDGNLSKRFTSPCARERAHHLKSSASATTLTTTTTTTATTLNTAPSSTTEAQFNMSSTMATSVLAQRRHQVEQFSERNLENILQASQQQVSAIETMLKGMEVPDKAVVSTTSRLIGKDPGGGSYRKIHAPLVASRVNVEAPASQPPNHRAPPVTSDPIFPEPGTFKPPSYANREPPNNLAKRVPNTSERSSQTFTLAPDSSNDAKIPKRVLKTEASQHSQHSQQQETITSTSSATTVPGFQRPLMRAPNSGKSSISSKCSADDSQPASLTAAAPDSYSSGCLDGLMSLNDALTEGLGSQADWSARVAAFTYIRRLLQQGPRGMHEVNQSFEKVMKLFYEHLDDPHHKVAHAALSTLTEIVPPCRRLFEAYLERLLPRVFARLVDAKEAIRQLGTSALEIIGNIYSIESLLPALLRSLDEQRSPKAKMAVIEFAIAAFAKLALSGESAGGSGMLKLWLAKLAPLANDKNPKLKETAVTGIISVYSHFDSATVLNFILGLSIEEQSVLRRALKQYTPRIEVDLMTFLQNRSTKGGRSRAASDNNDDPPAAAPAASSDESCKPRRHQNNLTAASSTSTGDSKRGATSHHQEAEVIEARGKFDHEAYLSVPEDPMIGYAREAIFGGGSELSPPDKSVRNGDARSIPLNPMGFVEPYLKVDSRATLGAAQGQGGGYEHLYEEKSMLRKPHMVPLPESGSARLLQKLLNWGEVPTHEKREVFQELMQLLKGNDLILWSQYPNQILTIMLEALDDPDQVLREISITTISELLTYQKATVDDSLEVILEKLIHSSRDHAVKVATLADRCLSSILSQCNPQRCLGVLIPFLVSDDDKTLVSCISCLTKLVTRLPQEELMAQLPTFLPALFDAFGNQNADVRKTVVFCLVDIYIVLGKAFVPYLGSLSSTQLRLVTIYANRISQARTGTTLDTQ